MNQQTIGTAIGMAVAIGVILWRNRKARPLRLRWLWVRPAIILVLAAVAIAAAPPPMTLASVAAMLATSAVGAALGWWRGRFIRVDVDPATREVSAQSSPLGVAFIVAILGLRLLVRGAAGAGSSPFGLPTVAITDGLLLMAAAIILVQSLEVGLRARRLLTAAKGSPAAATGSVAQRL